MIRHLPCITVIYCAPFSIALNSFDQGLFTYGRYIMNTYLYVILTFNISMVILEHSGLGINPVVNSGLS